MIDCLPLADDLKVLSCRAVRVCPGCGYVHPMFIARGGLGELRQRLEILLGSGAHATAATVVGFRV